MKQAVHTGLPTNQYVDQPISGSTHEEGQVTTGDVLASTGDVSVDAILFDMGWYRSEFYGYQPKSDQV